MEVFFLEILNMSLSASWIVLAVLILRLLLKKAPKWIIVLLWGIVAIRLICPLSIESALSLIPNAEPINPDILVDSTPVVDANDPVIDGVENPGIIGGGSPVIGDDPVVGDAPVVGEDPVTDTPTIETPANPLQTVISLSSYVWLAGIAGMLAYTLISYFRVKRRSGIAIRLQDNIYQSENVVSPFVLGLIQPKIYLPFGMDGQDMEYVIAHENAHIRRKDHWWKPIGFLILAIHWFNPLLWLGYVLLCRDIELACDEKVIKELNFQQKADYSQALLNCSVNRRILAACPLAFGEVGIKERVKSVLNYKKPAFWIIAVAIVASIVAAVCFLTNPVKDESSDQTDPGYTTTDAMEQFLNGEISATNKEGNKVSIQNYFRGSYNKYALYDMNGDAAPELILKTGQGLVILIENEQALIVWYHGTIYEKPLNNRAIFYERPGGAPERTNYQYIVLDHNGEKSQETSFAEYYGDNAEYFINGEKASKNAYQDLYKSFDLSDDGFVWQNIPTNWVYADFLSGYVTDTTLAYFTKDIDNNGIEELCILQNTVLTVYTYEDAVKKVGTHNFITGTLQLYHTKDTQYPGMVYVTVGGGKNHFGYITVKNGVLSVKQTFDDDYGMVSGKKEDVFYTQDENLIAVSKKAYEEGCRIEYAAKEYSAALTFQVNPSRPTYTAIVNYSDGNPKVAQSVTVADLAAKQEIQTFDLSGNELFAENVIYVADVSFDGNVDILIPQQRSASAAYFQAYIWLDCESRFVYAPLFENLPNIVIDSENMRILSTRTASQIISYSMSYYDAVARDFRVTHSVYWEPDASGNQMHFVEQQYESGAEITVKDCLVNMEMGKIDSQIAGYFVSGSFWDLNNQKWKNQFYNPSQEEAGTTEKTYTFTDVGLTVHSTADKSAFSQPISCTYNGKTIKLTPHFTGIPVTAVYYSQNYWFNERGVMVRVSTDAGGRKFLVDKNGKVVTDAYVPISTGGTVTPSTIGAEYSAGEGLYVYTDGTLYGLKNSAGTVITQPLYRRTLINFFGGYAVAERADGTFVAIDTTGKEYGTLPGGRSIGDKTFLKQEGEPGNYTQYLYDLQGNRISGGYDSISHFYDGLALIKKGNKLGLISADGTVVLEPSIECDVVTYPPRNDGFSYDFMDQNAFVIPIGGEIAIVTIEKS